MSRKLDRDRVARYVEARRGVIGLTQRELAERAGVDIKTINNLESGERWPQVKTRAAVERELEWTTGDLLRIAEGGEPTSTRTVYGTATAGAAALSAHASGIAYDATVRSVSSEPVLQLLDAARADRPVEEVAGLAGMDADRWRGIIAGVQPVTAVELARMGRALGVHSGDVRRAGRPDVANAMQDLDLDARYGDKTIEELDRESLEILDRIKASIEEDRSRADHIGQMVIDQQASGLAKTIAAFRQRRRDAS